MSAKVFDLTGKVVVVTGAAGGIGMAVCRQLGSSGATIVLSDVDKSGLERSKSELDSLGIKCGTFVSDASIESEVIAFYHMLRKSLGYLMCW